MDDARAQAPVTTESTDLTVTEAAEALSQEFQSEPGPADESRPPQALKEKEPDLPVFTDDTKVPMKDGTSVPLRELKRGYISRKTFTSGTQALAEERARFEHLRDSTENQSRLATAKHEALNRALSVLMPRPPDPSLVDVDPQLWKAVTADYQETMGLLAQVQRAAQMEFDAAQAARNAEERDLAHRRSMAKQNQADLVLEAMPDLKDAKTFKKFREDAIDTMAGYGFTEAELDALLDHRLIRPLRDLIRFKAALKKAPAVKEHVQNKPKLMRGGKRMDASARASIESRSEHEQLQKSGRLDDAGALFAKMFKG